MENGTIKKLFDNIALRIVITVLTLTAAVITIITIFQEKSVDLCFEITSNTNVLDVNAEITKLEVIYDSTNLKQTNENLRIFTIRVINNGKKDILKEYYDENDPIGLKIIGGKIIEPPEVINASSEYLSRNVNILDYQLNKISCSQVILESGEYFTLKLLVLHKQDSVPSLISFGKIAGQKEILVISTIEVKKEPSFWAKVYSGNIWIQLLRLLSFFLVIVIIAALGVGISEWFSGFNQKRKRSKLINAYKYLHKNKYSKKEEIIFEDYKELGSSRLLVMQELLDDVIKLNRIYSEGYPQYSFPGSRERMLGYSDMDVIESMINDGFVNKDLDRLSINKESKHTLDKFIDFLKRNDGLETSLDYFITDEAEEKDSSESD